MFWDIVVIKLGDFCYIDVKERIQNIFKNLDLGIYEVIQLEFWIFCNLCCDLFGDFFVIMDSNDVK